MRLFAGCLFVATLCWIYPSTTLGFDIEVDFAPNVLNIQSESVVVTVHTDIAYSDVVGSSVFLSGIEISPCKSDSRGNFVAKFLSDQVNTLDGLNIDNYKTLVLTGYTTLNEAFIGKQDIKVIDIIPQGKK